MGWAEALAEVIGRTGHERYRALCADDHPDRDLWRQRMIEMATGEAPAPAEYPSLGRQAASLAGAVGRVVGAAVRGEPIRVSPEVYRERLGICEACEQFDAKRKRCKICGCFTQQKLSLATESCPLPEPKWSKITDGQ